tara:strand:- start:516 stop:1079 length:564 start_codon:yes stop_codon:yes gene_type:complete
MRIILAFLFLLFLTSCSLPFFKKDTHNLSYEEYKQTLTKKTTKKFKLNGKLSLFIDQKGQTGKILWDYQNNVDSISILSPFNTKVAEVSLNELEKKISLKFSKESSRNSEDLISKIFGSEESIFLLKKFITNPPKQLAALEHITIQYNKWDVIYQGNKIIRGQLIPNTIEFKKNNISLKIFIIDWVL